jgi:cob(I)alamin adenosyltransferase
MALPPTNENFLFIRRGFRDLYQDQKVEVVKMKPRDAEMRAILEAAVGPDSRLLLGTALAEMSRRNGLTNADVEALEQAVDALRRQPHSHSIVPGGFEV